MDNLIANVEQQISRAIEETQRIDLFDEIHKREECPICFQILPIEEDD